MKARTAALLIAVPLLILYISLFLGRFHVAPAEVAQVLWSRLAGHAHASLALDTVVFKIRLPRALAALLVGAGLAASGAAYQGVFRNPLVSPDILGVTAASAFGAALALLLSRGAWGVQILAFGFGLAGVALTYLLARQYRTAPLLMLVLSGIIVAAFFGALLSAAKYVADPDAKLPAITYWLLGSLNAVSGGALAAAAIPIALGTAVLWLLRWRLNVLSLGHDESQALGVQSARLTAAVIVAGTLISAAAVSLAGIVGWVGLVIPHWARAWVGADHHLLIPASLSIGATYLLLIDDVARTAVAGEIPLGVLTALIGAPFFAYLLRPAKRGWQ